MVALLKYQVMLIQFSQIISAFGNEFDEVVNHTVSQNIPVFLSPHYHVGIDAILEEIWSLIEIFQILLKCIVFMINFKLFIRPFSRFADNPDFFGLTLKLFKLKNVLFSDFKAKKNPAKSCWKWSAANQSFPRVFCSIRQGFCE